MVGEDLGKEWQHECERLSEVKEKLREGERRKTVDSFETMARNKKQKLEAVKEALLQLGSAGAVQS